MLVTPLIWPVRMILAATASLHFLWYAAALCFFFKLLVGSWVFTMIDWLSDNNDDVSSIPMPRILSV
jgi:hypothetical protein